MQGRPRKDGPRTRSGAPASRDDRGDVQLDATTAERHADDPARDDHPGAEMLRLMVGAVLDYAIFALDPHGRVTTWNEGARRLKQYE